MKNHDNYPETLHENARKALRAGHERDKRRERANKAWKQRKKFRRQSRLIQGD